MKTLARIILFGGDRGLSNGLLVGTRTVVFPKKPHLAAIKFAKFQTARVEPLAYSL